MAERIGRELGGAQPRPVSARNQPKSHHRVNWPAVNGLAAELSPKARRLLDLLALTSGGATVALHVKLLTIRLHCSRGTIYRALRELVDAGIVEHHARYAPGRAHPRRLAGSIRLSNACKILAYRATSRNQPKSHPATTKEQASTNIRERPGPVKVRRPPRGTMSPSDLAERRRFLERQLSEIGKASA